jgi:hypothetical protein
VSSERLSIGRDLGINPREAENERSMTEKHCVSKGVNTSVEGTRPSRPCARLRFGGQAQNQPVPDSSTMETCVQEGTSGTVR